NLPASGARCSVCTVRRQSFFETSALVVSMGLDIFAPGAFALGAISGTQQGRCQYQKSNWLAASLAPLLPPDFLLCLFATWRRRDAHRFTHCVVKFNRAL